jgi:stage II sporulation protein D
MVPPLNRGPFVLVVALCLLSIFFARQVRADGQNTVRVAILKDAVMVRLTIKGFYRIEDAATQVLLYCGKDLTGAVTAFKGSVSLGGRKYTAPKLFIAADAPDGCEVNGRRYHGQIGIVRSTAAMTVINYVGLEDYVKGIAVREISHYWPVEALRAHAIVFRTYALYAMKQNASRDFDVTGDVYSQVYGGPAAERYRINDAVDDTAGDVLTYKGELFPAYFHSTCGGHTEAAKALWNIDLAPLSGVVCIYCKDSPYYFWRASIPVAQATKALTKSGIKVTDLSDIEILDLDASGRATDLVLRSSRGQGVEISAKDFRNILGPGVVKSTAFGVSLRSGKIELSGRGWGHGVGLCQWGAYFMAKAGYSATEILDFYYPKAQNSNIYAPKVK